jgi:hypothetical protein
MLKSTINKRQSSFLTKENKQQPIYKLEETQFPSLLNSPSVLGTSKAPSKAGTSKAGTSTSKAGTSTSKAGTSTSKAAPSKAAPSKFSFANVLNNENKEEEETKEEEEITETPPEGWVYLKKKEGKIYYKYGVMSEHYTNLLLENQAYESRRDRIHFKIRIDRLQQERNIINDLLGDLSPYWEVKTLYEMYNIRKNDNKKEEDNIEEEDTIKKEEEWIKV